MATWKTLLLQDSASPVMEQLMFFHDHSLLILIMITILMGQMMISMLFNKFTYRYLFEGQLTEMIWTILPAGILILIQGTNSIMMQMAIVTIFVMYSVIQRKLNPP